MGRITNEPLSTCARTRSSFSWRFSSALSRVDFTGSPRLVFRGRLAWVRATNRLFLDGSTRPGGPGSLARDVLTQPWSTLAIMSSTTEITVLGGVRHRVEGDIKDVEHVILNAARGSIMEFAWFTDAQSGESLVLNPDYVVMLRTVMATD